MTKFDIASDMHISQWWQTTKIWHKNGPSNKKKDRSPLYIDWEWYRKQIGGEAEVLLIAGDLGNGTDIALKTLKHATEAYPLVIYIDGNHEHYGKQAYSNNMQVMTDAAITGCVFLSPDKPVFIIGEIAVVGCNGWYDWRCYEHLGLSESEANLEWRNGLNDATDILFDQGDPAKLAMEQAAVLMKAVGDLQLNDSVKKIIMMTHSSPRMELMVWKKDDMEWNSLTPSFVNSQMRAALTADTEKKISHWIYGHTHARQTVTYDGITYINNCRGYPRELTGWSIQQILL